MTDHGLQIFPRSFQVQPPGTRTGDVDDAAPVRLTVVLKPHAPVDPTAPAQAHAAYARAHGTRDNVTERFAAYARSHGLHVEQPAGSFHMLTLSGTYAQARSAFRPEELGLYEDAGRTFVGRGGHISVPPELAADLVAVVGFDQRPIARPHFRMRAHASAGVSYDPAAVARHYGFPAGTGAGQTVALIELGGGYDPAQMTAYFAAKGVHRTGTLESVPVGGATNTPGDPNGADGEVQLDIEVVGSVAPAADIAVYFGANQGSGFLDAIAAAVHDTARNPSVISISWGGPESSWSAQDIDAMDQVLQTAAGLGITVTAASGDSGASDGTTGGMLTVDFPASSPHVLGCGGTRLPHAGAEVAWNDGAQGGATGGGYSTHFARPAWQTGNTKTGRGVPDVAGDADPQTGYNVSVDGQPAVIGGTSAVAPLWAGLVALSNQAAGHNAGFANPALYAHPAAMTDITHGNNAGYSCTKGWDPVTGLGSPKGAAVATALRGTAAGV
ncbi:MAG: S53 family peptidase [Janthinobacterium lividum]